MLERNQKDNLRPADKWLIKTKFKGKYIIDWFKDKKLDTCLIIYNIEDIDKIGTDKKEIVTCFNQVLIILEKPLRAELKPDDKIEIKRIWTEYAKRRAYNLKEDSTITDDYKNLLRQAYKDRYKQIVSNDFPNSKVPMTESVGIGIIEGTNEMTEKEKKELRKGLEDMKGTRSASYVIG